MVKKIVIAAALTILSVFLMSFPSLPCATNVPVKGMILPPFLLSAPANEDDQKYLGLEGETFELKDVRCQLIIIEILSVYCPLCHQQLPHFNRLFSMLGRKNVMQKVKMFGIAVGATAIEVEFLRKDASYNYPVIQDEQFTVHKLLCEPRTPFTMLVNVEGRVLHSQQGIIEDVDSLYKIIREALED